MVIWDMMSCSLVEEHQRFGDNKFLQNVGFTYQTRRHHIPDECNMNYY